MPRKKTEEGHCKTAVLDLLAAERIFVLRVNSGNLLIERANGSKHRVQMAPKGTADILAIVPMLGGTFMPTWVETKAGKNGLNPDQQDFRDDVLARGHCFLLARSSDDVLDWLRAFRKRHSL